MSRPVSPAPPPDPELRAAVEGALREALPGAALRCGVHHGVVQLEGEVAHLADRDRAGAVAAGVGGVLGVANHLAVRVTTSGERVRAAVELALERAARDLREPELPDDVRVDVDAGTVSLTGELSSWPEKAAVLDAVRRAPGVGAVEDHLHVDR